MKKFIKSATAVIMAVTMLALLGACGKKENSNTNTTTKTDTRVGDALIMGEDYRPDKEALCALYQQGVWDGKFIYDERSANCASIENGVLWTNCRETGYIPDAEGDEVDADFDGFVKKSANGTWVTSESKILLTNKGKVVRTIATPFGSFGFGATGMGDYIIAYDGEGLLFVYDESGATVAAFSNAIDFKIDGDKLYVYKPNSDNCVFQNGTTTFLEEDVSIAAQNPQATIIELKEESAAYERVLAENYQRTWTGEYRWFEKYKCFAIVDDDGFVVVNNKRTNSNVHLPASFIIENDGWNYLADKDDGNLLIIDGELKKFLNGKEVASVKIGSYDKGGSILHIIDDKIALKLYEDGGLFTFAIVDMAGKTAYVVQEHLLDVRCAYDSIYTMDKEYNGYVIDGWAAKDSPKPLKVIEDVTFVSHHWDESEGFVRQGLGSYGGLGTIYGPYCSPYPELN